MATTAQTLETVRRIQTAMSTAYTTMGAWCLIHPASVIALSLTPAYSLAHPTTYLIMRCFGAQAMTTGLLLGVSPLDSRSFKAFAWMMVPYLGFNAWFLGGPGRGVFTSWLWLDAVGNIAFCAGSWACSRWMAEVESEKAKGL